MAQSESETLSVLGVGWGVTLHDANTCVLALWCQISGFLDFFFQVPICFVCSYDVLLCVLFLHVQVIAAYIANSAGEKRARVYLEISVSRLYFCRECGLFCVIRENEQLQQK